MLIKYPSILPTWIEEWSMHLLQVWLWIGAWSGSFWRDCVAEPMESPHVVPSPLGRLDPAQQRQTCGRTLQSKFLRHSVPAYPLEPQSVLTEDFVVSPLLLQTCVAATAAHLGERNKTWVLSIVLLGDLRHNNADSLGKQRTAFFIPL